MSPIASSVTSTSTSTTSGPDLNSPSSSSAGHRPNNSPSTSTPHTTAHSSPSPTSTAPNHNNNNNTNIQLDKRPAAPSYSSSPSARSNSSPLPRDALPKSILIVGAGVFGLSTALALTKHSDFDGTAITIVDRSPEPGVFPSRDASSIDTSRIIRADYSDPDYAALAAEAQDQWRRCDHPDDLGAEGRYSETGLMLVADAPTSSPAPRHEDGQNTNKKKKTGLDYVRNSWDNVRALHPSAPQIVELPTRDAIRSAYGTGGASGTWGYVNHLSGWADADASMAWLYRRVVATGRVAFVHGTVASLVYSSNAGDPFAVQGVRLADEKKTTLVSDLVILAAGAWTPSLVDLTGRAVATGQVLAYMDLTPAEQARLRGIPTLLNLSTGYFIITPSRNTLKVARHAYGYLNPAPSSSSGGTISQPVTHLTSPDLSIPAEEQIGLRRALREMIPWPELRDRPFSSTRLCWYTDTPNGDFIIDYHPRHAGLFLATAGSGHGFKFLPVIGERIVDCVLGQCPAAFREKWKFDKGEDQRPQKRWDQVVTEDGSRGGTPGLTLHEVAQGKPKASRL